MKKRMIWIGAALAILCVLAVAFPFAWRSWIMRQYTPEIATVESVNSQRVAIVFGARVYGEGRLSAMVRDRVETAIALYEAGKVDKLLISGDNQNPDYNEPGDMMAYAIARGVPAQDIQPDYGGRRTYDTCYRALHIFQVESAILVTQEFHLPRALFTCEELGITVQGVAADQREYSPRSIAWSESREIPATMVALLDVVRKSPPPVMGEPIPIQ